LASGETHESRVISFYVSETTFGFVAIDPCFVHTHFPIFHFLHFNLLYNIDVRKFHFFGQNCVSHSLGWVSNNKSFSTCVTRYLNVRVLSIILWCFSLFPHFGFSSMDVEIRTLLMSCRSCLGDGCCCLPFQFTIFRFCYLFDWHV
jgi:hypothetical protein